MELKQLQSILPFNEMNTVVYIYYYHYFKFRDATVA